MGRMFIQDMEEAGVFMGNLDPAEIVADGKTLDPHKLAPILHTVTRFPNLFTNDRRLGMLRQLDQEYQSGFISSDWAEKTARALKSAVAECSPQPRISQNIFEGNYNRFALDHYSFYEDRLLPEVGIATGISAPFRQDADFAHTTEEMDLALHSLYDAVTQMGDQIDFPDGVRPGEQVESFRAALDDYFQHRGPQDSVSFVVPGAFGIPMGHMPGSPQDMKRFQTARDKALEFCGMLEANPTARNKQLAGIYEAKKAASLSADRQLGSRIESAKIVSGQVEKLNDDIDSIRGLWEKMRTEDKGRHKNSPEYQRMYDAVKSAVEIADVYNMEDPKAIRLMRESLDIVRSASTDYVEAKVVDKKKGTKMGIERKNTALALLQITDPATFNELAGDVKDFRQSKKKTHTSLRELISEEKKEARKRIAKDPQKEAHKELRKHREHRRTEQRNERTV